ncbi:MAG: hypothetical protein HY048_01365 [Acidobacteria bacterium]|nr:hypothetical protein [Acidobacteriota bacterium]
MKLPMLPMLTMLSVDDKVAEIKRLYYKTTKATIQEDLTKALDLLKSMASEEERERVAVFMDGLSQMRSDWGIRRKKEEGRRRKERRRQKAEGTKKAEGRSRGPRTTDRFL